MLAPRNKEDISVGADGRFSRSRRLRQRRRPGGAAGDRARLEDCGRRLPDFPRGLLLVANVGEEGEGNLLGMRHLCKQSPLAAKRSKRS